MLVYGTVGAGVGALVDLGHRGYSIVDGPPLASANARRSPPPVTLLDDLWLRIRQGDTIRVVTRNGQTIAGKFVQVSNTSVRLAVEGTPRDIPSSDVSRVTRSGNRYRSGALWGGAIAATVGLVASAGCEGSGCGNPLLVAVFVDSSGALWGTLIGAAISKHVVVYGAVGSSTARVTPVLGRGRIGLAVSATF